MKNTEEILEKYADQFKPKKKPASEPPAKGTAILIYAENGFVRIGVYTGRYLAHDGTEVKDAKEWIKIPD